MNHSPTAQLILEFLYQRKNNTVQFFNIDVHPDLQQLAEQKGATLESNTVRETFWFLVGQGLVAPGARSAGGDQTLPWVSITQYGIDCFEAGEILPYDPNGFLESIFSQIPTLDSIIRLYLTEACGCYMKGLYLSSVVMTGCSLERTIIHLTEEFHSRMSNPSLKTTFESDVLNKNKIKNKFDGFITFVEREGCKDSLTQSEKEQFDSLFKNIFSHIRITRNEAGHPTGRSIDRDEAQANLLLLKVILIYIYSELIDNIKIP